MNKTTSKHSIRLMLAVILLAVCMGMTATYAAFSATATSNGTVSFSGDFQITEKTNGGSSYSAASGSAGTYSLTAMAISITLGTTDTISFGESGKLASVKVNSNSMPYYWQVKLTINKGTGYSNGFVNTLTAATLSGETATVEKTSNAVVTWKNTTAATSELTVTLADLITAIDIDPSKVGQTSGAMTTTTCSLEIQARVGAAY